MALCCATHSGSTFVRKIYFTQNVQNIFPKQFYKLSSKISSKYFTKNWASKIGQEIPDLCTIYIYSDLKNFILIQINVVLTHTGLIPTRFYFNTYLKQNKTRTLVNKNIHNNQCPREKIWDV